MNKVLMIFEFVFGCWHRQLSRPFTLSGWTREVCLSCGKEFAYDRAEICSGVAGPQNLALLNDSNESGWRLWSSRENHSARNSNATDMIRCSRLLHLTTLRNGLLRREKRNEATVCGIIRLLRILVTSSRLGQFLLQLKQPPKLIYVARTCRR